MFDELRRDLQKDYHSLSPYKPFIGLSLPLFVKIMRLKFFFLLLLGISFHMSAQTPSYSTKNKKAIEYLELGKQYIMHRKLPDAILNFKKAIEKDDKFVEAYIALAGAHRILREDEKVKFYLLSAFSIQPTIPEASYEYFVLANLLLKEGDYKNATFYLDKFFSFNPTDKRVLTIAQKMKATCQFAQEALQHPILFSPTELEKPLNQFQNQYFPSLTADGQLLLYTVRQAAGIQDEENLFFSELKSNVWTDPQQLSTRINTKANEGTASISGDGKTVVYTFCTERNGCDLYMSQKIGKEWTQPQNIGNQINTRAWESQPSLSADGRTLYFASERPGGIGGIDIWVTKLDSNDVWTSPINLGPTINTPEHEFSPFIHANGTSLYFSSQGHVGMGGIDLFFTERLGDTAWATPRNFGYPINTFADESGMFISTDFKKGYFSKDYKAKDGSYASRLYAFDLSDNLKGKTNVIYLKGRVLDAETKQPLKATVELTNLKKALLEQKVVSDGTDGKYLLVVPFDQNYGLFVSSPGYLYKSLNFNSNDEKLASNESFDILLTPLHKNATMTLNNLFFETGKYDLDALSRIELDKLSKFLRTNKRKIEISGHTDNVGTTLDNQSLSEKRAQSVFNYLTTSGIPKENMRFKGYGATQPVGNNTTLEGKKANRRIEIKILE